MDELKMSRLVTYTTLAEHTEINSIAKYVNIDWLRCIYNENNLGMSI